MGIFGTQIQINLKPMILFLDHIVEKIENQSSHQ